MRRYFIAIQGKYGRITEQQNGWAERSKIGLFSIQFLRLLLLNSLTPVIDQNRISPYNINTLWGSQKVRIKKNINWGIISWSNTKSSKLTSEELYRRQWGELVRRITNEMLGVKKRIFKGTSIFCRSRITPHWCHYKWRSQERYANQTKK